MRRRVSNPDPHEVFHSEATPRCRPTARHARGGRCSGRRAVRVDWELPTIGIYGKIEAAKGSYDLVAALGDLKRRGRRFNFLAMCGGDASGSPLEAIVEPASRRKPVACRSRALARARLPTR